MLRRTAVNNLAQNKSQNGPGNSDPVKMLSRLLGSDVVLLPVWAKSKKPKDSNWTKLTSKDMQSPRHLHKLHYSNIGVLLGKASGGLCTIDIDSDEHVPEFLRANPLMKQTLQSKGQRGQNFWVKIRGEYPSTKKISRNVEAIGEWRANDSQTVIHGIHPCGEPYRILQHTPPIEIDFEEIQWPEGWSIKKTLKSQQQITLLGTESAASEAQSTPVATTDQAKRPKPKQPNQIEIESVEQAIQETLPTQAHKNNDAIFKFTRSLLNVEAITGVQLGREESDKAFDQWCEQNPYLDSNKMKEYKEKFMYGRVKARLPLFEDPRAYAAEQAKDEVDGSKDPLALLDRFLFHLQSTTDLKALFISCADLATYLGQMTHTSWHKKIPLLEYKEVIKTLKTGAFRKGASEYVYLNHPCWTQDDESRAALKRLLASVEDGSGLNMGLLTTASLRAFFTRAA